MTAREGAAQLGVTPRTVRRLKAEARDDFETRARERRVRAAQMRNAGASYKQIGEALSCTTGAVGALLHLARREGLLIEQAVKRAG